MRIVQIKKNNKIIASNQIKDLEELFTFKNIDACFTEITPKEDIIFGVINRFGEYKQWTKSFLIPKCNEESLPITLLLPKGREIINKNNLRLSDIHKQIEKLSKEEEKLKTEYSKFYPE